MRDTGNSVQPIGILSKRHNLKVHNVCRIEFVSPVSVEGMERQKLLVEFQGIGEDFLLPGP